MVLYDRTRRQELRTQPNAHDNQMAYPPPARMVQESAIQEFFSTWGAYAYASDEDSSQRNTRRISSG